MSEGMHGCVVASILMLVSVAKSKATLLVRPPTVLTDCDMVIPEEGVYACVKSVDEGSICWFRIVFIRINPLCLYEPSITLYESSIPSIKPLYGYRGLYRGFIEAIEGL